MRSLLLLLLTASLWGQDFYLTGFAAKKLYHAAGGHWHAIPLAGNPVDVVLSPGGAYAYVSQPTRDALTVIRTADDAMVASLVLPAPRNLAIGNGGTRLYVVHDSEQGPHLSILDTGAEPGAARPLATLDLRAHGAHSATAVAAFGSLLAVGTSTGHVLLYDTTALPPAFLASREVGARVTQLVFSPWGTKLYVLLAHPAAGLSTCTSGTAGNLPVLEVPALAVRTVIAAGAAELTAAAVVNGSHLYVADRRGTLHAIDIGSDTRLSSLHVGEQLTGLAALPNRLLAADAARDLVYTISAGRRGQPDRLEGSRRLEHALPLALAAVEERRSAVGSQQAGAKKKESGERSQEPGVTARAVVPDPGQ